MAGPSKSGEKSDLQANAEKALEMKKAAGPQSSIPEHRTSHDGGVKGSQVDATDVALTKGPANTPNLSRSHNARSGDAGGR